MNRIKQMIPQNIKNYYHKVMIRLFNIYYDDPSSKLAVIGVTGTDGKTTTCTLIYEILKGAGYKVGLITTISARIGEESIPTGFHVTTPDPQVLLNLMKRMIDAGMEYVVLETTSHGLDQNRVSTIKFHAGIFTNVTHEHLDYHKTYEAYLNTKATLIHLIKPGGFVVINLDDKSSEVLCKKASDHKLKTYTYGFTEKADLFATDYEDTTTTTKFNVHNGDQTFPVEMHLPGEYNVYNALGAIQVGLELGISQDVVARALSDVKTLEGRWEVLQKEPYKVVVDFAHTPNALEKMLEYARQDNPTGRLIVVFGTAGKRDIEKRPQMGRIAGNLADLVILTAEDPRGENIININRQIAVGLAEVGKIEEKDYFSITDRRKAIARAMKLAKPGDTVVITGKGHEKSMNIDGVNEIPWSDQMVVKELITNG